MKNDDLRRSCHGPEGVTMMEKRLMKNQCAHVCESRLAAKPAESVCFTLLLFTSMQIL